MLLYTPVDIGLVLADYDKPRADFRQLTLVNGITLLVEPVSNGFRIERVLSGNSNAYLLSDYQPGQVISVP